MTKKFLGNLSLTLFILIIVIVVVGAAEQQQIGLAILFIAPIYYLIVSSCLISFIFWLNMEMATRRKLDTLPTKVNLLPARIALYIIILVVTLLILSTISRT